MVLCMYEFYKKCSSATEGGGSVDDKQIKPENRLYMGTALPSIKNDLAYCFSHGYVSPDLPENQKMVLLMNDDDAVFIRMFENCLKTDAKISKRTRNSLHRIFDHIISPHGVHLLYIVG